MKKSFAISFVLFLCICISSGFMMNQHLNTPEVTAPAFKMSKKVNAIVKDKCYGCHSENGRAQKAKDKLMWDELGSLEVAERTEKMQKIVKVIAEGAMPPARMLERMPEKKLTEKEGKKMTKWAQKYLK